MEQRRARGRIVEVAGAAAVARRAVEGDDAGQEEDEAYERVLGKNDRLAVGRREGEKAALVDDEGGQRRDDAA